jgi:hypothetical protein
MAFTKVQPLWRHAATALQAFFVNQHTEYARQDS